MRENSNTQTKILKNIFLILAVLMIAQGILIGIDYLLQPESEIDPIITTYQLIEPAEDIKLIWTRSNVYSFYTAKGGRLLDSIDESIYMLARFESDDINGLSLIKFNLLSGEIIWRTIDSRPAPFGDPLVAGLATNSTQVFVNFLGTISISGEMLSGAAKLRAYDIEGNSLWSRRVGGARSIKTIIATNDTIGIDGNFSSNYYQFDANTGNVLNTIPKDNGNFIWFEDNGIIYEQTNESVLQTINKASGNMLWQNLIDDPIYMPPVFSDKYSVVRTKDSRFPGNVVAIDLDTGKTIWEFSNTISNVAVDNLIAYFLLEDMQLIGVDIKTGKVILQAGFYPNKAIDSVNNVYQVTASNNVVVVYFGGTNQLAAFRLVMEN